MEERTCILNAMLEQGFNLEVVAEFFRLFGGQRVYIAKKLKEDSKLTLLDPKLAEWLLKTFSGEVLDIPYARSARAQLYIEKGLSYNEIAKLTGCSRSTITKMKHLDNSFQ